MQPTTSIGYSTWVTNSSSVSRSASALRLISRLPQTGSVELDDGAHHFDRALARYGHHGPGELRAALIENGIRLAAAADRGRSGCRDRDGPVTLDGERVAADLQRDLLGGFERQLAAVERDRAVLVLELGHRTRHH